MKLVDIYHSFLNFFFLLLCERLWYTIFAGLGAQQQFPQLTHEEPRVLSIQEPSKVDLHFLGTRELGVEETGSGKKSSYIINRHQFWYFTPYHLARLFNYFCSTNCYHFYKINRFKENKNNWKAVKSAAYSIYKSKTISSTEMTRVRKRVVCTCDIKFHFISAGTGSATAKRRQREDAASHADCYEALRTRRRRKEMQRGLLSSVFIPVRVLRTQPHYAERKA